MRGYAAIGLDNPKTPANIGAALRACSVFDAAFLAVSGGRYKKKGCDTCATPRHKPFFMVDDLHSIVPYDCVPVAIEFIHTAIPLTEYQHPRSAFYIFGAEDATLGERVLSWCRDVVYIPADYCLNLAACVNVVLYDRMMKLHKPLDNPRS